MPPVSTLRLDPGDVGHCELDRSCAESGPGLFCTTRDCGGRGVTFTEQLLIHVYITIEAMESIAGGEACAKPGRTWASRAAVREESRREQHFYRSVCLLVSTDSYGVVLC